MNDGDGWSATAVNKAREVIVNVNCVDVAPYTARGPGGRGCRVRTVRLG